MIVDQQHGVACAACGDGYRLHEEAERRGLVRGACTVSSCPCLGFRWLPPVDVDDDQADDERLPSSLGMNRRGPGYPRGS